MNYDKTNDNHESREELDEVEGITFFLHRMRRLLDDIFALDVRHYASTLLHSKYRSLKACFAMERTESDRYVRQQAELIYIDSNESNQREREEPKAKKFKGDLFRRFESDGPDAQLESGNESGNESE